MLKKILKGLTALVICGALNFGLTNDAQAAEFNSLTDPGGTEYQELARSSGHESPPPHSKHHGDYCNEHHQAPPPHHS